MNFLHDFKQFLSVAWYRVTSKLGQKGVGKKAHWSCSENDWRCLWPVYLDFRPPVSFSSGRPLSLLFLCSLELSNLEFLWKLRFEEWCAKAHCSCSRIIGGLLRLVVIWLCTFHFMASLCLQRVISTVGALYFHPTQSTYSTAGATSIWDGVFKPFKNHCSSILMYLSIWY